MNLKKLIGNQIVVALIFATMLLFSGFIFEGSEHFQTIMMLIIALYFSVMAAIDNGRQKSCKRRNCRLAIKQN